MNDLSVLASWVAVGMAIMLATSLVLRASRRRDDWPSVFVSGCLLGPLSLIVLAIVVYSLLRERSADGAIESGD